MHFSGFGLRAGSGGFVFDIVFAVSSRTSVFWRRDHGKSSAAPFCPTLTQSARRGGGHFPACLKSETKPAVYTLHTFVIFVVFALFPVTEISYFTVLHGTRTASPARTGFRAPPRPGSRGGFPGRPGRPVLWFSPRKSPPTPPDIAQWHRIVMRTRQTAVSRCPTSPGRQAYLKKATSSACRTDRSTRKNRQVDPKKATSKPPDALSPVRVLSCFFARKYMVLTSKRHAFPTD